MAASNRYLYYESSPFTNLMCGLEYLIDRDGQQRDTSYTTVAAQSGNVLLLQNRAYLGLGFVADPALGGFVAEQNVYNPIKEQEEMFRMATGLDDALYTHLKYDTLEAPEACDLRASGTSGTQYSYSTQDADGQSELSISYVVPQDGLLVATTKSSGNYDLTVYRNGERLFTRNIKVRCLFSLGCFEAGDTVTLTYPVAEGKEGTISLDVAEQNDAVFDAGLSRLSRSVWNVTEDTDTSLSGTVDAAEDGLFYTSIPYENGWRAYVDGVEVPLAPDGQRLVRERPADGRRHRLPADGRAAHHRAALYRAWPEDRRDHLRREPRPVPAAGAAPAPPPAVRRRGGRAARDGIRPAAG